MSETKSKIRIVPPKPKPEPKPGPEVKPGKPQIKPPRQLPPAQVTKEPKPEDPAKKPKPDIDIKDIKIPMAMLVYTITGAIAEGKNDERYLATDKEAKAIEDAFNQWVEFRLAFLAIIMPELILAMPILNYVLRISTMGPKPKKE